MSGGIWKNLIDADTAEVATKLVIDERFRQEDKWGQQDTTNELMTTILLEEFGEVAKEMNDGTADSNNFLIELVQLTAVAHKWLEIELRRRSNLDEKVS